MSIDHTLVGQGPTKVITVHGWFGGQDGWGLLPELIDTEAYTFVFFDLRGYGSRTEVAGDYTLEEVADDVFALANELRWQEFALVGHSMGDSAAGLRPPPRADHRCRGDQPGTRLRRPA